MKIENWAKKARGYYGLNNNEGWQSSKSDARLLVEKTTKSVFLSRGPAEHFSNLKPKRIRQSNPDQLTIDDLYGSYDARKQTIEIYRQQISHDCSSLGCTVEQLTHIVRLHEYGHAVVHVGVAFKSVDEVLAEIGGDSRTDWKRILRRRTKAFRAIPEEAGELLAQSITWAALAEETGLQLTFETLEQRQPSQYRLSAQVKAVAARTNWPLVLTAARGEVVSLPRRASRRDALEELICLVAA